MIKYTMREVAKENMAIKLNPNGPLVMRKRAWAETWTDARKFSLRMIITETMKIRR